MEAIVNVLGVILSFSCLLFALFELRVRSRMIEQRALSGEVLPMLMSHKSALRMAAIMIALSWLTMGLVALSYLNSASLLRQQSGDIQLKKASISQIGTWQYTAPDGGIIQYNGEDEPEGQLVGTEEWHAQQKERL